jgi:hypothetical protein
MPPSKNFNRKKADEGEVAKRLVLIENECPSP